MAEPPGISLAPADYTMAASPTWTRIDQTYNVTSWAIDRGRQNEMSRTGTGTARVELVDQTGAFDPTNATSPFYGRLTGYSSSPMGPLVQANIALQNPVTSSWSTLFRGFISQLSWVPYQNEQWANVTLDLVDALAVFAACEMPSDFGDDFIDGNIVFYEDDGGGTSPYPVQNRINKVLDGIGWDTSLRNIFTGNVKLQKTVYAPRSTALQVMQDAADAEFPDIANLYIGGPHNPGKVVFHGRHARFDPASYSTFIQFWKTGDDAAANADPTHVVRISPPLTASLDDTLLYTSALATPQNIADGDISAQYVNADPPAVATKGLRTWSAENLATLGGQADGLDGNDETKRFATYIVKNYATPFVRVGQLTIKPRAPSSAWGPATWALMCGIDISDVVHLKTTHHGGGGFDTDFYVEGIHYTARPGSATVPIVELVLDVSPRAYYTTDPWA